MFWHEAIEIMENEKEEVVLGLGNASSPEPFITNASSPVSTSQRRSGYPTTPLYTENYSSTLEEDEDLTYGSISSYTVGVADASVNEELVTGQFSGILNDPLDYSVCYCVRQFR